jgi:deoxyribodipyrimidine photo-lyase
MIQPQRITPLNDRPVRDGRFVLYWMQASQREHFNHALEYAAGRANELGKPLLAVFGLTDSYPEANLRHYMFMLQGLARTQQALADRGVQLVVRRADPPHRAAEDLADGACLIVTDCGYTRHQRQWRAELADDAPCRVVEVEADVVVPVETASDKQEYSAATIRSKLHRRLEEFLKPLRRRKLKHGSLGLKISGGLDLSDPQKLAESLKLDKSVGPSPRFTGGTGEARRLLRRFIRDKLARYADKRNDPSLDIQSHMSPYLHFGQISPVWIALQIQKADAPQKAKDAYLEELIVRRELAANFVYYCDGYDCYESAVPDWARRTLAHHASDARPTTYGWAELASARTHDAYWNAAQKEMLVTGKMHNYMRMYWGKKIIEWSQSPQAAFTTMISLNNRYFIDGRNPNSWTNVAWCFGRHDRPWAERPIFGKVRYMNAAGLERKFDIEAYVRQVEALAAASMK